MEIEADDTDLFTSVCLQIDPDIKLQEIPSNGHEFLLKVMNERKNCPAITKCKLDPSRLSSKQSVFAKEKPPIKEAPLELRPTIEWQNIQVADFSKERMYISKLLLDKKSWPETKENAIIKEINKRPSDPLWFSIFKSEAPTLSCILRIDQTKIENGLKALNKCLKDTSPGESISPLTGQWIYSILAYIQLPLLADTISVLRELARICAELRSQIDLKGEDPVGAAAPMNLFICLISKYFGQTDLPC